MLFKETLRTYEELGLIQTLVRESLNLKPSNSEKHVQGNNTDTKTLLRTSRIPYFVF